MKYPKSLYSILTTLLILIAASQAAYAEKYLVLLDSSDGMGEQLDGERVLYAAVKEVVKFIDKLDPQSKAGVMVFGHTPDGCEDAELVVPFDKPNPEKVQEALGKLSPTGRRGLVHAISKALEQIDKEGGDKVAIFLVTCGWDECGGRSFEIEDAFGKTKTDSRLVIIGINPDERQADKLKEIAGLGNGTYYNVEHLSELGTLLSEIAQGTTASLQVVMKGSDPETPYGQLKIYDNKAQLVLSKSIQGFFSTDLDPGNYDIQLIYQGNNFWRRGVYIRKNESTQIVFDLDVVMGELRVQILDAHNERMKGDIIIKDDLAQVVYEGTSQSEYAVTLPPGFYSAEVTVGSEVQYFDDMEVFEEGISEFPAVFTIMLGTAEIVVNNADGVPVNASIVIENSEGKPIAESDYTSTFLVTLPPGDYTAVVTTRTDQQETVSFFVPEADNITVDVEIESPMGSILVRLVTPDGDPVFGRIRVYDERGREVPYFERESIEDSEFTFDVPVGTYRIEAQSESVIRTVDNVTVTEGDENIVEITFPQELA